MKISKVSMFAIGGIATLCTLSLIVEAASSFPVSIHLGLSNAAQHISSVEFVDDTIPGRVVVDSTREHMHISGANNFFLSEDGSNKITDSTLSSILGGFRNTISRGSSSVVVGGSGNHLTGNNSVIRGGIRNKIEGGSGLAIMGGSGNTIKSGSQNSTILGGENNEINGNNSVIAGNNSTIVGNNSVALGSGVTVKGHNSFLWSDGTTPQTLTGDGRFVVMSEKGMVVNLSGAADGAQLTIGGPIIVTYSDNDSGATCGGGNGTGMIKLVKNESADSSGDCLCACNGSGRNSLYGGGRCETMCKGSIVDNSEPKCGNNVERIPQEDGTYTYSGSCEVGSMVKNQIYVDKDGYIHWLCQTLAGTKKCQGS